MNSWSKRGVSLLLCLLLIFSTAGSSLAADGKKTTSDKVKDTVKTGVSETKQQTKQILEPELFVSAAPEAGLTNRVRVTMDPLTHIGTLYLPGTVDPEKLTYSWSDKSMSLSKEGVPCANGSAPVAPAGAGIRYVIKRGEKSEEWTLNTCKGSPDVRPMFLEIDESKGRMDLMNWDDDHETPCYGTVALGGEPRYMSIKGRGNSTWKKLWKKPYNITLYGDPDFQKKTKAEFLPGVFSKKWTLLANYYDNSLMRNKIAQDLACDLGIGLPSDFVDVYMNGEYLGNYLLSPKKDSFAPKDGYFLEFDNQEREEDQFKLPGILAPGDHNRITIRDIGSGAEKAGENKKTIRKWFYKAWKAALTADSEEYQNYFDLDSWAKMYLMYEVSKTYSCYSGSLLMHRDGLTESDKLIAGPAWDYDVDFGRTLHKFASGVSIPDQVTAEGWYVENVGAEIDSLPANLLQALWNHKSFQEAVKKTYRENQTAFAKVSDNVLAQQERCRDSALMNNVKWGTNSICGEYVVLPDTMRALGTAPYQLNYEVTTTWDNYVHNLREYCVKRVLWMTDHL